VIIVLFGVMNIGALIGFMLDARERRAYLAQLQTPALGFREEKGAWLWRLHLEPLKEEIDAPTGPAVALSAMLGMPLSRLRTCLPDDMLGWDLGASLGRQHVFSTKLMAAALDAHQQLVPPLFGGSGCCGTSGGVAAADDAAAVDAEAAASHACVMEDFIGTALVLAFLQCAALVPVAQLAERRSAAKRHFAGVTTVCFPSHRIPFLQCVYALTMTRCDAQPAGWDFAKVQTDFVTLVSPGIVNGTKNWLPTARLCA
jgi:hypothetical protein